ncbi:LysR family transcriptional regulator [Marinobacterium halophilum]|uniref:LysR family transcriptional regulator n=1 Tax=Marinobacterium halophilum TaxID=267374 RepID=A0A2P8ETX7_9GAMM|nr:LysR family transcriptional regulator [Marinobacterium halophilum]PSL12895.1 LysR family transcriptional regulator [Marinobacterium halophilum]
MNYQDLYYFIKVVEKGSLVSAARYLDIPTSTLSRRLQAFEQQLGYKLVHRSSKKFGLTESGQRFFSSLSPVMTELEMRSEDVNSELSSLSGDIKVTAPLTLGHHYVKEWVFEFMEINPRVSVEMFLSNQNVDLVKNSIDIAFRLGKVTLNDWISRPLMETEMVVVATPELLNRHPQPQQPEGLAELPLVVLKRSAFWRFQDSDGHAVTFTPHAHLRTDEIRFAVDAVKRGLGACCLPRYVVADELARGELVQLLSDWSMEGRTMHMLYPHRESLPAKTRALIEFVMEKVQQNPGSV